MHRRVGVLIAIVALGGLAQDAEAAGHAATAPLRRVAEGFARSDGSRFVAISRMSLTDPDFASSVAVFDEHTRRTRVLPGGCPAIAVGSGFLLAGCIDQPWRVFDLARRTDQAIAPIPWEPPAGNNDRINTVPGIGSRWLAFEQESSPHGNVVQRRYEDWRTGRVRSDPGGRFVADLDAPTLVRPLCRPLARTFDSWTLAFDAYQYERHYGAREDLRGRLVLDRCGQRRPTVLAAAAASIQLAAGILTWLTIHPGDARRPWRYFLHARSLRTGRTMTWRVTLSRRRMVISVQHTARAIYATVVNADDERAGTNVVLRAALPNV
jgi:hypothetical protein